MIKSCSFLFLGLLLSVLAPATELTDLGQGLSYLRISSLAECDAALRQAVPDAGTLVLDLRYTTGGDDALASLRAALTGHSATAPLFILVSPATPPAIAQAITASPAAVFTLGLAGSRPAPKVVVQTDPATDRRAYDALAAGTPVATLISGKIEKEHFDEATLVQEFKNGNPAAEPPPAPDPTAPKANDPAPKDTPLVDRVLQRAVHLHRAMIALRR